MLIKERLSLAKNAKGRKIFEKRIKKRNYFPLHYRAVLSSQVGVSRRIAANATAAWRKRQFTA
jgi:hypothetical protein